MLLETLLRKQTTLCTLCSKTKNLGSAFDLLKICFNPSDALPRTRYWHIITPKFLRSILRRHFPGKRPLPLIIFSLHALYNYQNPTSGLLSMLRLHWLSYYLGICYSPLVAKSAGFLTAKKKRIKLAKVVLYRYFGPTSWILLKQLFLSPSWPLSE